METDNLWAQLADDAHWSGCSFFSFFTNFSLYGIHRRLVGSDSMTRAYTSDSTYWNTNLVEFEDLSDFERAY